eukprot:CAMPEP_0198419982 /NCGR_PEP_ID=MMETSP1452-20131203/578_1 /TAXON_ID=1181717 /ORGANISM="Synchroma pusillum, Strain CCMP3072" /LENGTH=440 /DNA_ID=CAMNT_0044140127 /DNA_START=20 /DNA_END=1342 /DNA_ORIENTATION=+
MGRGGQQPRAESQPHHVDAVKATVGRREPPARGDTLEDIDTTSLSKWGMLYGIAGAETMARQELLAALRPHETGILDKYAPAPAPLAPLPFKMKDIISAIPKHCFKRCLWTSCMHLASDIVTALAIFALAQLIEHPALPVWVPYVLYPVYWFVQGAVLTGVWVIAHECGHQAFSESELINNYVGTVLHSFLLVPYSSWRITHANHHGNTGSCENDEVFAPSVRSDFGEAVESSPLYATFEIVRMLTVGWLPGYLVFNASGPAKYRGKNASHFSPSSVLFTDEERPLIAQSVAAWFVMVAVIAGWVYTYGIGAVVKHYWMPLMWVNCNLVLITYLQHTDCYLAHFREGEWDWLRGAMCTVDRSYGTWLDHTFHRIADTHVMHHLVSRLPFYHAEEATEAVKPILGDYYLYDSTPIVHALWRANKACKYVDEDKSIVFYKSH